MQKLPASAGWSWITKGFALVRKQPIELLTLLMAYMLLMALLLSIPLLGQIIAAILTPVFTMAFMQACVDVERGRRVTLQLLLVGFRSPALRRLILLGLLYLAAALIASIVLILIDKDTLVKLAQKQITADSQEFRDSHLLFAFFAAAMVYMPAAMAFWYAAPLIAWKEMKLGKALFYSFFAVIKASKAFVVYGLGLALLFLPVMVTSIAGGNSLIIKALSLPMMFLFFIVVYCSYYPNYTDIFGKQVPAAG